MSAKRLIDLLESNAMLEDSVISELRKQVAASSKASAASLAKALVDKGQLTKFQATKLVGQVTELEEENREQKAKAKQSGTDLGLAPDEDDLGFAPMDDGPGEESADSESAEEVVLLEDADGAGGADEVAGLTPVEDAGGGLTPVGAPPVAVTPPKPAVLEPLDAFGDASDPGVGNVQADPFGARAGHAQPRLPKAPRGKKTRWDTKLMLGGFGGLALLSIVGVVLYINLTATPALEMWEAAMEDYRTESYSQAMAKFEKFLSKYPEDPNASEARARIVLCQIRVVLSDPQKGMDRAKELLPTIESEKAFATARDELAKMLIQVPEGFVKKARQTDNMEKKEEFAKLADVGMTDLVENPSWVPTSKREAIGADIRNIKEETARVWRDINQDKDLRQALNDIANALSSDNTPRAFEVYKALIKVYPGLDRDPDLLESVLKIAEREKKLVRGDSTPIEALQKDEDRRSDFRVVLASRTTSGQSQVQNMVATVLAGGSVFGLDAGTGQVLWDRFVGVATQYHPVPMSAQPDADVLLADENHVIRLKARTGEVVWRLPINEPFASPVVGGNVVYIPTESGSLIEADAETGNSSRRVKIPQRLGVGPGVDSDRPLLFQVGEHSSLYALSKDDLACRDVHYLGHKPGTIVAAPVVLRGHVFVAENAGTDYARLHILAITDGVDKPLMKVAQTPIRLTGNVTVPMLLYGRRLLVVTDRGEVQVYNIDLNKEEPVSVAAQRPATPDRAMTIYPLAEGSELWLADNRLSRFTIQVTTKNVNPRENLNRGDTFIAPLQLHGDLLVHTRRMQGSSGARVTAVNIDSPRKRVWQVDLGVPAGRVEVNPTTNGIMVISAAASLFEITREVLANGYNDRPKMTAVSASGKLSFTDQIECSDGRVAFFNPADNGQVLVYDPSAGGKPLHVIPIGNADTEAACVPTAFAGGLLVPFANGDIKLFDLSKGDAKAAPFVPRLEPGETVKWRRPAVVDDGSQFVIVDDRRKIYRIGLQDQPTPVLTELAKAQLEVDVDSELASVGDTVYGVARSSSGDSIVAIGLADLKLAKDFDLKGERVTWGPRRVGDAVLVVTDSSKIYCFEAGQKMRWEKPAVAHGQPAGAPLIDGTDYVFASMGGAVWKVQGTSGQELNKSDLGEPLASGPVAFAGRLLLCGTGGALHVITMPAGS